MLNIYKIFGITKEDTLRLPEEDKTLETPQTKRKRAEKNLKDNPDLKAESAMPNNSAFGEHGYHNQHKIGSEDWYDREQAIREDINVKLKEVGLVGEAPHPNENAVRDGAKEHYFNMDYMPGDAFGENDPLHPNYIPEQYDDPYDPETPIKDFTKRLYKAFGIYKDRLTVHEESEQAFPGHGLTHPDALTMQQGRHPMDLAYYLSNAQMMGPDGTPQNMNQHLNPTIVHGRHGPAGMTTSWMEFDHPKTGEQMVYDPVFQLMGTRADAYENAISHGFDRRDILRTVGQMPKNLRDAFDPQWASQPLLAARHRYGSDEVKQLWETHGHSGPFSQAERSMIPRLKAVDEEEAAGMPPKD